MMKSFTINNAVGLHARPAALFVQTANSFEADITVTNNGKQGNAKSLLSILSLGVKKGSEIVVEARGADSREAMQAIETLIESGLGE